MPVFKNIAKTDLYLPREDGLNPDLRLLPDCKFSGSVAFYNKYTLAPDYLISRVAEGWTVPSAITAGPDALTVLVDGYFKVNGVIATTADATAFGSPVVATTAYTAFGKITWYEGTTQYTKTFSCNSGSGFVFSAITPLGATSSATSGVVTLKKGQIVFGLAGATAINPTVAIVYEPSEQGWRGPTYRNPLLDGPFLTTKQTVSASSQVTQKTVFYTGSKVGDPKIVTNMVYTGTQTAPDTIVEELGQVTAADLNF